MARLSDEMRTAARGLEGKADGYRMAGERALARAATDACNALRHAAVLCDQLNQLELTAARGKPNG